MAPSPRGVAEAYVPVFARAEDRYMRVERTKQARGLCELEEIEKGPCWGTDSQGSNPA